MKSVAMFNAHSDPIVAIGSQESGGQNVYVRSLATELDRQGWRVDVFTRWNNKKKKQIVSLGKRSRIIRLQGGPIAHIPKNELFQVLPEMYENFRKFIGNENTYDVFHGHYWDGGWLALKAHEEFHKPFIQTFHSLGKVRLRTKQQYSQRLAENHYDTRFQIEEEIAQRAAQIISLAETEKEDLFSLYNIPREKTQVIPGAVNLKLFYPMQKLIARDLVGISEDDYIILYVGRLEWRKGIGTAISALRHLREKIPNVKLVVIGGSLFGAHKNKTDVEEYQRLLVKAEEEHVSDRIQFLGRINHKLLHTYCSAADVQIVPSYYEPFGLVALEGMASGVPVAASDVGGLKNIIAHKETGMLFQPRNPIDLGDKVFELFSSPILTQKIIKDAYRHIRNNYSWSDIGKKIAGVYNQAIVTS